MGFGRDRSGCWACQLLPWNCVASSVFVNSRRNGHLFFCLQSGCGGVLVRAAGLRQDGHSLYRRFIAYTQTSTARQAMRQTTRLVAIGSVLVITATPAGFSIASHTWVGRAFVSGLDIRAHRSNSDNADATGIPPEFWHPQHFPISCQWGWGQSSCWCCESSTEISVLTWHS